jgi:hypothetical protein
VRFRNSDGTIEVRECVALTLAAVLPFAAFGADRGKPGLTSAPIVTPPAIAALTPAGGTPSVKGEVPQAILESILNEAAALAKVARDQLMIVRAESAVWNDGSLGCPEPGMMYTQALVNGYWIVIEAAGRQYDFRVDIRHNRRTPSEASVPMFRQETWSRASSVFRTCPRIHWRRRIVEATPKSLRLRKRILDPAARKCSIVVTSLFR